MGTIEEDVPATAPSPFPSPSLEEAQNQTEVFPGFNPSSPESDEQSLVEGLQNVALKKETQSWNSEEKDSNGEGDSDGTAKDQYPLRPYAGDCPFYLRTGKCKFGLYCRFNHPVKRANQQGAQEKDRDEFVEQTRNTECKYYLTAGGCKFGEACRYCHSKEQTEIVPPELNFLGLPIRQGEKVCPFYLRNGSCGYGAACRFDHPDPTDLQGSDSYNFTSTVKSMGGSNRSLGNHNGESDLSQPLLGTSQPAVASWTSHMNMISDETVSYLDNRSSLVPVTHSISQEVDETYEWNGSEASVYPQERKWQINSPPAPDNSVKADVSTYHQQQIEPDEFPERPGQPDCDHFLKTGNCKFRSACRYNHPKTQDSKLRIYAPSLNNLPAKPFYMRERTWEANSAPALDIFKRKVDVSGHHQQRIQVEEFPERPGQPDCAYFIKTGDCKYRSACRYHHPRNRVSTLPVCVLSDKGLPLRPDKKICWHYEQYGICKYGRCCLFDHPVDHCSSASPVGLDANPPSGSYFATFGGNIMDGSGAGSEILIPQPV